MFRIFLAAVLLLTAVCPVRGGTAGAGVAENTVDFIYVNANTGEAAGGHTALRMGATVFHFQFFPQGRFLLVRDSWSHFRYVYNELRNRSISIARLSLTSQTYSRLRNHFSGLLMSQQLDLSNLENAEARLQLLQQLADPAEDLELPAVGLFDRYSGGDPDMARLRAHILQQLGPSFLGDMQEQVEERLAAQADVSGPENGLPRPLMLQEALLEREFTRLVTAGASLDRAVITVFPLAAELTSEESVLLGRYRQRLAASVVSLLLSNRSDRAEALLLQTARYLVVSRSLTEARLLTLDPFSSKAVPVLLEQRDELQGLYNQLEMDAARARHNFFQESLYPDIAYAILETVQGRLSEVAGAVQAGRMIRVEPGILLPGRSGMVSRAGLFPERLNPADAAAAEEVTARLRRQVVERYGYDLVRRNCATELVRALNSAFPDPETGRRELGGWLEPDKELAFIPNQWFRLVQERFPLQDEGLLLSRRLRKLAELYQAGSWKRIWIQESNTLGSTLYTPRSQDTPFLFFSDDVSWLRPVFGVTNFCWAALHGLGGVFTLPVDGGERIYQGLRGMFYSLPELVFSNIRKGTYGLAEVVPAGP